VLFALVDQLINLFRRQLTYHQLRVAQIQTLRTELFKVGALTKQTTRRIWLHLASGWPCQQLLAGAIDNVAAIPAPPDGHSHNQTC